MSKHYTMITETCSCGAKLEIETISLEEGEQLLAQWRVKHQHYVAYPYRYVYPQVTWGPTYSNGSWIINNASLSSTPPEDPPGLSVVAS